MVDRRTADKDNPLYLGWRDCLRVRPTTEWAYQQTVLAVPLRLYDIRLESLKVRLCSGLVIPR